MIHTEKESTMSICVKKVQHETFIDNGKLVPIKFRLEFDVEERNNNSLANFSRGNGKEQMDFKYLNLDTYSTVSLTCHITQGKSVYSLSAYAASPQNGNNNTLLIHRLISYHGLRTHLDLCKYSGQCNGADEETDKHTNS